MNSRRKKSFHERRQELAGSVDIISGALREFEQTGKIHLLRIVASQLRALIVYKSHSSSLRHPLLFELAKEKGLPLTVYSTDQGYKDKLKSMFGQSMVYYSTGDPFNLEKDEIYKTPLTLEDAMETLSVEMLGQHLSVKDVLSHVADTEASHYDPGTPPILDELGRVEFGGLPTHYRLVYALGRTVRDLGIRFLQATT